jgi:probable DNA repair protein
MRALRKRGLQRTHWKLSTFQDQRLAAAPLPDPWVQRLKAALAKLQSLARGELAPVDWADTVPQLLETIGWPGTNGLASAEFQVIQRWRQALDSCGSLGFDGRRMNWQDFLSELLNAAAETLFAPESKDAPILIAGPAESAGLTADAIWFLGAHEDAWPTRGDVHPFIPIEVQRRSQMPHSTPQLDWDVAHAMTTRLAASAREVNFSYARQADGVDLRVSRITAEFAGLPHRLSPNLIAPPPAGDKSIPVSDIAAVSYRTSLNDGAAIPVRGGAGLLTAQSQCAFKAFATGRLDARTWDPAEVGLTAPERGQLVHEVLHSVWAGPPDGIRSSQELKAIANLPDFIRDHVRAAMGKVPARIREEMARYLDLEATRLTRLISEWLAYEQQRLDFEVIGTEIANTRSIAGLSLDLRLDRLDRLNDKSLLVIDYKTGDVAPEAWDLPRPEDVQLPLYAGFGIDADEEIGGLVFAKVRAGNMCFAGKVGDAAATLDSGLKGTASLVKYPLELDQLLAWRDTIEQLARDFLSGRADVNPKDVTKTCQRCGLQPLCRINERAGVISDEETEAVDD